MTDDELRRLVWRGYSDDRLSTGTQRAYAFPYKAQCLRCTRIDDLPPGKDTYEMLGKVGWTLADQVYMCGGCTGRLISAGFMERVGEPKSGMSKITENGQKAFDVEMAARSKRVQEMFDTMIVDGHERVWLDQVKRR